jgi:membrane protein YdbS with pleckstrin-like domain
MKYETIPKKCLIIWEVMAVILYGAVFLLCWKIIPYHTFFWYVILWVLGGLFILTVFLYLPLLYLSIAYQITDTDIIVKGGVIYTKTRFMNRKNISFATVYRSPLTPLFHVSTLMITSPGASLIIPFMDSKRADKIAAELFCPHTQKEESV